MAFPRSRLARSALLLASAAACVAGATAAGAEEKPPLRACAEMDIPARPSDRVWCTTPNATLVIAHQSDPVLLEGTEVRVLSAERLGTNVRVRVRVRNQTNAQQSLSAGGQELYLNLAGERIDLAVFRDVSFGVGEAKTLHLDFTPAPEQWATLDARGGRLDFGVRPWHDGALPAPLVGVVRVRVSG